MSKKRYEQLPDGVEEYLGFTKKIKDGITERTFRLHEGIRRIGYYRLLAPAAALLALFALRNGWLPIK